MKNNVHLIAELRQSELTFVDSVPTTKARVTTPTICDEMHRHDYQFDTAMFVNDVLGPCHLLRWLTMILVIQLTTDAKAK